MTRTRLAEGEAGTIDVAGRQVKVGVQGAIYLFCSPDSDFVSGQTLVVTGGG